MKPPKLSTGDAFDFVHFYGNSPVRLVVCYAEALLNVAEKQGIAEQVGNELDSLVEDVFEKHPEFEATTTTRRLSRRTVDEMIIKAFEGKASTLFVDTLRLLNERDRNFLVRPIAAAYRYLRNQRLDRVGVMVTTAAPPTEAFRRELTATLTAMLKAEPVVRYREDPEILGGMIVRVGTKVFDGSVRYRLNMIRTQILSRGSHEIQTRRDRFCNPG